MTNAFQNSLLGRLFAWLARIWPDSLACRIGMAWGRCVEGSVLLRPLRRFFERGAERSEGSFLARLVTVWNRFLGSRTRLRAAVHESLLGCLWGVVQRCLTGSRLVGWFFRGGVTGLFLWALALYVPLDWILRDVVHIPVLGSVWDELLLLASIAWIFWMKVDQKTELEARITPLHAPVLGFVILAVAEMFFVSPYRSIALSGLRATVQYMLWFFVIVSLLRDERDFFKVYLTITLVGAIIALHGVYQYIVAVPIPTEWMSSSEERVRTRVFSIFGSPNIMGDYMVLMAAMAAGLFFYCRKAWQKLLAAAVTGTMCLACLFTMSRGAWIALVVAVLVFVAITDKRLLAAMLVLGVCAMFLPFVWSRMSYLFSDNFWYLSTNGGRISRWQLGLSYLYRTNPVFGMGLGMYGGAVAMQTQRLHWAFYTYVDNYYLKLFVEMGWVGLVGFVLLLLSLLLVGGRVCRRCRTDKQGRALMAGLYAGLAGVMVHLFIENIFEEPYMMALYWCLAGLMVWYGFLRGRNRKEA